MFGEEDPTTLAVGGRNDTLGENPHTTPPSARKTRPPLWWVKREVGTTHLMGEEIRMTTMVQGEEDSPTGIAGEHGGGGGSSSGSPFGSF